MMMHLQILWYVDVLLSKERDWSNLPVWLVQLYLSTYSWNVLISSVVHHCDECCCPKYLGSYWSRLWMPLRTLWFRYPSHSPKNMILLILLHYIAWWMWCLFLQYHAKHAFGMQPSNIEILLSCSLNLVYWLWSYFVLSVCNVLLATWYTVGLMVGDSCTWAPTLETTQMTCVWRFEPQQHSSDNCSLHISVNALLIL